MKKILLTLLCLAVCGQLLLASGFSSKSSYLGPLIGFGWHDLMLGGQFEHAVSPYVGIGALAGFSHKSYPDFWGDLSYNYVAVCFQCNYHFRQVKSFDLFAGGVLGYDIISSSVSYNPGYEWYRDYSATHSRMIIGPEVGANFPLTKTTAISARLGYPFYFAAGFNFKL